MIKKRLILKFTVTNKNILLRYNEQLKKDPDFSHVKMAEKFGAVDSNGKGIRGRIWKWMETGTHKRLPSKSYVCNHCHKSQWDRVYDWINDGTLNKKKGK